MNTTTTPATLPHKFPRGCKCCVTGYCKNFGNSTGHACERRASPGESTDPDLLTCAAERK